VLAIDWGYDGDKGPENWGKINPAYSLCETGIKQSPVMMNTCQKMNTIGLTLQLVPSQLSIKEENNTIVFTPSQKSKVIFEGNSYDLISFHLHAPSEHEIDEKKYPSEIHFLLENALLGWLKIGVMVDIGSSTNDVDKLFQGVSSMAGTFEVDLNKLMPKDKEYFHYMGSLTTPPCTENIRWIVFRNAISTSLENIQAFSDKYPKNSRPINRLNERTLL
jgi:carbonic anhydrase